jgi:hypothetical protein
MILGVLIKIWTRCLPYLRQIPHRFATMLSPIFTSDTSPLRHHAVSHIYVRYLTVTPPCCLPYLRQIPHRYATKLSPIFTSDISPLRHHAVSHIYVRYLTVTPPCCLPYLRQIPHRYATMLSPIFTSDTSPLRHHAVSHIYVRYLTVTPPCYATEGYNSDLKIQARKWGSRSRIWLYIKLMLLKYAVVGGLLERVCDVFFSGP